MEKIWKDRRMTALIDISRDNVQAIRDGSNDSGNAPSINALVGDDTTSRLIIDGDGILKVQGNTNTVFEGAVGIGVLAVTQGIALETNGPVRFQNKKQEVGNSIQSYWTLQSGRYCMERCP